MISSIKHCVPCVEVTEPLSEEEENKFLQDLPLWKITREDFSKISRSFKFKNFKRGMEFVNKVATLAELEGHHPDIYISFSLVFIEMYSHNIKGLSENDFILATKIGKAFGD